MLGIKSLRQNLNRFLIIWGIIYGAVCKANDLLVIGLSWLLEFSCLSPNSTHPQALAQSLPPVGSLSVCTGSCLLVPCWDFLVFSVLYGKPLIKTFMHPWLESCPLRSKELVCLCFFSHRADSRVIPRNHKRVNPPLLPPTAEFRRRTCLPFSGCAEKYHGPVSERSSH